MGGGRGGGAIRGTRGGKPRKQKGKMPMDHKKQNEQAKAVARKLKLTPDQREQLHRLAGGRGWGYQEMLEAAKNWFIK